MKKKATIGILVFFICSFFTPILSLAEGEGNFTVAQYVYGDEKFTVANYVYGHNPLELEVYPSFLINVPIDYYPVVIKGTDFGVSEETFKIEVLDESGINLVESFENAVFEPNYIRGNMRIHNELELDRDYTLKIWFGDEEVYTEVLEVTDDPLIFGIKPWGIPEGLKDFSLTLLGFNLDKLSPSTKIKVITDEAFEIGISSTMQMPENEYDELRTDIRITGDYSLTDNNLYVRIVDSPNSPRYYYGILPSIKITNESVIIDFDDKELNLSAGDKDSEKYVFKFYGYNITNSSDYSVDIYDFNNNRKLIKKGVPVDINDIGLKAYTLEAFIPKNEFFLNGYYEIVINDASIGGSYTFGVFIERSSEEIYIFPETLPANYRFINLKINGNFPIKKGYEIQLKELEDSSGDNLVNSHDLVGSSTEISGRIGLTKPLENNKTYSLTLIFYNDDHSVNKVYVQEIEATSEPIVRAVFPRYLAPGIEALDLEIRGYNFDLDQKVCLKINDIELEAKVTELFFNNSGEDFLLARFDFEEVEEFKDDIAVGSLFIGSIGGEENNLAGFILTVTDEPYFFYFDSERFQTSAKNSTDSYCFQFKGYNINFSDVTNGRYELKIFNKRHEEVKSIPLTEIIADDTTYKTVTIRGDLSKEEVNLEGEYNLKVFDTFMNNLISPTFGFKVETTEIQYIYPEILPANLDRFLIYIHGSNIWEYGEECKVELLEVNGEQERDVLEGWDLDLGGRSIGGWLVIDDDYNNGNGLIANQKYTMKIFKNDEAFWEKDFIASPWINVKVENGEITQIIGTEDSNIAQGFKTAEPNKYVAPPLKEIFMVFLPNDPI